jgi:hypothetical protein
VKALRALLPAWLALSVCGAGTAAAGDEAAPRWSGLDEAVIEKLAAEAGRTPRPVWFELEGDLALFLFLCAGIAGGSVLGYYFRMLFVERIDERPAPTQIHGKPRAS